MMKVISVHDAVGSVLCHDMTRIVSGEYKGPTFTKGHIVKLEDIPHLLSMGKENIYVLDVEPHQLHENDAALRMAKAIAGQGISLSSIAEGRINFLAERGLLHINVEAVNAINAIEDIALATMHTNQFLASPRAVAGTRIIPLLIDAAKVEEIERICAAHFPVIRVDPLRHHKIGLITTGSEIYHGRIKDTFGPVIVEKYTALGSTIIGQRFVDDKQDMTVDAIKAFLAEGAEMIVLTGGMSVDPDDQTPSSIRAAGAEIISYGAPTFPGAMFMLGYIGDVPILGLPGCVMYYRASIFELIVPRLLAGERLSRRDITSLGHGGFCAGCAECRYPLCSFGKV